jgi:hypothetical protein
MVNESMDKDFKRRALWLGKFAFPQINTKRTEIRVVSSAFHKIVFPVLELLDMTERNPPLDVANFKKDIVELKTWVYNGKHRKVQIRFGYYERLDVLFVAIARFLN